MSKYGPRPDIMQTNGNLGDPVQNTMRVMAAKTGPHSPHPISRTFGYHPSQVEHLQKGVDRAHADEPGFDAKRHEVLKFEG